MIFNPFLTRGLHDMELDASSMEKRFAYKFLKKILKYVDSAQGFISHLGKCVPSIFRLLIKIAKNFALILFLVKYQTQFWSSSFQNSNATHVVFLVRMKNFFITLLMLLSDGWFLSRRAESLMRLKIKDLMRLFPRVFFRLVLSLIIDGVVSGWDIFCTAAGPHARQCRIGLPVFAGKYL